MATDPEFTAIIEDPEFRNFYFHKYDYKPQDFLFIRDDLRKRRTGYLKPPFDWWWVNNVWRLTDFMAQCYINLIIWGINPFDWMEDVTDPVLGFDGENAIATLTIPCKVRQGVVKNLKYAPQKRKDNVVYHFFYGRENYGIGCDKLYLIVREEYFNVSLRDVRKLLKRTTEWQLHARVPGGSNTNAFINHPNYISGPCRRIQLDTVFFPSRAHANVANCMLTMIDCFSKKAWAWPSHAVLTNNHGTLDSNTCWVHCGQTITDLAARATQEGEKLLIQTDDGKEFKKEFNRGVLALAEAGLQVKHGPSMSHSSRRTGCIEAFNKTIKNMIFGWITAQGETGHNWETEVATFLENYNNTPHSATGFTPNELHNINASDETVNAAWEKMNRRAHSWLDKSAQLISKSQASIGVGDIVRRRLTKRISKELAKEFDARDRNDVDRSLSFQFIRHSWSHHWTRQLYRVAKLIKSKSTQAQRVLLDKVEPILGNKDKLVCYDYVTNLMKVPEKNISRASYQPIEPPADLEAPYEARLTFPEEAKLYPEEEENKMLTSAGIANSNLWGKLGAKPEVKPAPPKPHHVQFPPIPNEPVPYLSDEDEPQGLVEDLPPIFEPLPNEPLPELEMSEAPTNVLASELPDEFVEDEEGNVTLVRKPKKGSRQPNRPLGMQLRSKQLSLVQQLQSEYNQAAPIDNVAGWTYKDNQGGGNCFFIALADNFNAFNLEGRNNWTHKEVRQRLTHKTNYGVWNTQEDVLNVPQVFDVVLGYVHNNTPELTKYRYYYWDAAGNKVQEREHYNSTPVGKPLVRIAYTGNHYKMVTGEPPTKQPGYMPPMPV